MNLDPQVAIAADDGEIVVARISGEIDLASAPAVRANLAEAVPNQALGLVIDLTTTSYLDSSGVSLIFELAERLRMRQQKLRLVVPEKAPLRRVLRIVNVAGVVPIVATVAEADAQIRAPAADQD